MDSTRAQIIIEILPSETSFSWDWKCIIKLVRPKNPEEQRFSLLNLAKKSFPLNLQFIYSVNFLPSIEIWWFKIDELVQCRRWFNTFVFNTLTLQTVVKERQGDESYAFTTIAFSAAWRVSGMESWKLYIWTRRRPFKCFAKRHQLSMKSICSNWVCRLYTKRTRTIPISRLFNSCDSKEESNIHGINNHPLL